MENGWSAPPSVSPRPPRWGPRRFRHAEHPLFHLALLVLTLATTTFSGALFGPATTFLDALTQGLRFSVPAMVILGVHEMGHYLMCRRYGLAATYPYFLPGPPVLTPFGTFGAVIRIKEPIRQKTVLLDVGAAGPLAGFVMSLAFLLYSVGRAVPVKALPEAGTYLFDYPLVVRFAQDLVGTGRYTSANVHEDPTFMAAWFGLLVTAFNLLPIGQLDGGHVLRAALGRRQPVVSYGVVALALVGALRGAYAWAFFTVVVVAFVGVVHPPVDDDEETLGTGRLTIALVCLCVFLLCFSLVPIKITS